MMLQIPSKNQLLKRVLEFRTNHSIDVVKLANSMGIRVYSVEHYKGSASIEYKKETGEYSIFVNASEPITRQRFSIAHELAHLVLHPEILHEVGVLNRITDDMSDEISDIENEADDLAAEILMPEEMVESFLSENKVDITNIENTNVNNLAEHFKVSKFVAVMRLRELHYHVPYLDFA